MPLWTGEELAKIAPMYPSAADVWQNRFECLGGVPRLVLQDIRKDPQELLTNACTSCSLDDCIMLVSIDSEISSKTKISLIHIHSQEPYQDDEVAYASDLAMSVIARTKWVSDRAKLQQLFAVLATSDGNRLVQALCGYIFEPYCMNLLEQGGTFTYRELLSGKQVRSRKVSKRKRRHRNNRDSAVIAASANNDCEKKHDIKGGAAEDLAKLGWQSTVLFASTALYYEEFTKKTPQTIKQFGILIPYPDQVN
ncbi:LOW QUALITY PROTEIN: Crinkler (CRN), partial [Phytophthora megakarya]